MSRKFAVAYFAHSIRSDWNNGNAHFLRGLLRALANTGDSVAIFESEDEWSLRNLREEGFGTQSLNQFASTYSDLPLTTYQAADVTDSRFWRHKLVNIEIVILHEWNPPALAHTLLNLRDELGFTLLFHDTHHRASSSPQQIESFGISRFDGVLAFGEALRKIYQQSFGIERVWTLHEAADTTIFHPNPRSHLIDTDVIWIGNWGDNERSAEIDNFLLQPASQLRERSFFIYGVRYPTEGLAALQGAGVSYGGYLPNLDAPAAYAQSRLTVHIPRQQYTNAMKGIPTIRVFEALASGIPLISAPWHDTEGLFREGDYLKVHNSVEMRRAIEDLLDDPGAANAQAARGLETILARHTCGHRAEQLNAIFEEQRR